MSEVRIKNGHGDQALATELKPAKKEDEKVQISVRGNSIESVLEEPVRVVKMVFIP